MTIASIEPVDMLKVKSFRPARNGFYVPDFRGRDYREIPSQFLYELQNKRFKSNQLKYISAVMDRDELEVIHDHLEDALIISIVDCMSKEKLQGFYDRFTPDPVHANMYHALQRQWMFRAFDEAKRRHGGVDPDNKEMMEDIEKYIRLRFRAYWRIRFPEKSQRVVHEPVRRPKIALRA